MRPINKPPGSSAPQTSDCIKSYGAMNANDPVIIQPLTCKMSCKIEILIRLFFENVEVFHNCLKLRYLFWPKNKTPFYRFVSDPVSDPDSDPDSNPDSYPDPKCFFLDPYRIRIRPKVSDPYGSGSGSATLNIWLVLAIQTVMPVGYTILLLSAKTRQGKQRNEASRLRKCFKRSQRYHSLGLRRSLFAN
jgi:hypothetical protein